MMRTVLVLAFLAVPMVYTASQRCLPLYPSSKGLQSSIKPYTCYTLSDGVFDLASPLKVGPGTELSGSGRGTILRVDASAWKTWGLEGMIELVGQKNIISKLTLDGDGVAAYNVAGAYVEIDDSDLVNGRVGSVGVSGPGVVVRRSLLHSVAKDRYVEGRGLFNCQYSASAKTGLPLCTAIYAQGGPEGGGTRDYAPTITDTTIYDIVGPPIDINRVNGGTLLGNTIEGKTGWAAFSLYGSSRWTVRRNKFAEDHSAIPQPLTHLEISRFRRSAAVFVATDDPAQPADWNIFEDNEMDGFFGYLLVGIPRLGIVPRGNHFRNNHFDKTVVKCISDQAEPPVNSCETVQKK